MGSRRLRRYSWGNEPDHKRRKYSLYDVGPSFLGGDPPRDGEKHRAHPRNGAVETTVVVTGNGTSLAELVSRDASHRDTTTGSDPAPPTQECQDLKPTGNDLSVQELVLVCPMNPQC